MVHDGKSIIELNGVAVSVPDNLFEFGVVFLGWGVGLSKECLLLYGFSLGLEAEVRVCFFLQGFRVAIELF